MSAFSDLGVTFAHVGAEWSEPTLTNSLNELSSLGITKLRINIPNWQTEAFNTSFRDLLRNVVVTALDLGFHCIWGYTVDGVSDLTNTTMTGGYHDALVAMATWVHGIANNENFELCLGNEDDGRVDGVTVTTAQYQAYVRGTLADDVKTAAPEIKTSYATHTEYLADWVADGLGSLDYFSLNVYGSDAVFEPNARSLATTFGQNGYVSEFNSTNGYDDYNDELQHAGEIYRRYWFMRKLGIPRIYFYSWTSGAATQKWVLKKTDGSYRTALIALTSKRQFLVPGF